MPIQKIKIDDKWVEVYGSTGENLELFASKDYVDEQIAAIPEPDAVLYTAQTLTDEQKAQARTNVDVYSKDEVEAKLQNINLAYTNVASDVTILESFVNQKQDKITGTVGDFVVIGTDGNVTTKTIPYAEEASF